MATVSNAGSSTARLRDSAVRVGSAALLLIALSCSQDRAPSSSSPTGPAPSGATLVEGIVRGEAPPNSRFSMPPPALAGADVSVIAGAATGRATTTSANGEYRLQLPRGAFKLRWSKAGYQPAESEDSIASTDPITMSDVVLRTAPWAIAGLVADGHANPVAGATVTIGGNSFATNFGSATTDADGRYRFTSTQPHFATVTVFVRKDGYESGDTKTVACCTSEGDTRTDVRLRRIVSITMTGPSTLGIGEAAALPINDITLDDASHRFIYLLPTSSDPSVAVVERGFMGQQGYGIRGVGLGTAIITCDWEKFSVQQQVRVMNR